MTYKASRYIAEQRAKDDRAGDVMAKIRADRDARWQAELDAEMEDLRRRRAEADLER